jgi:hypothetical protein
MLKDFQRFGKPAVAIFKVKCLSGCFGSPGNGRCVAGRAVIGGAVEPDAIQKGANMSLKKIMFERKKF